MYPLRHKFNAVRTEEGGRKYASRLEARYAKHLAAEVAAGRVLGWIEQAPLRLPGGSTYRLDFLVFCADGTVDAVEIKGMETPVWRLKYALAKEGYPWLPIRVLKARDVPK